MTLNRTASALERKPYQIGLLFTHTCKNGDFGEKTRGREGARARGRESARAREREGAIVRRADLYKVESHIWDKCSYYTR